MAIEYKDINQLTQKSSVAGTEKIEVSDTEYITPSQIASLVGSSFVPYSTERVTDANLWTTIGYALTNGTLPTANLPSICTGSDRWGVLFWIAENASRVTGTQMYYPIDGTYKGRIFYRSAANNVWTSWELIPLGSEKQDTLVSGTNIKTINNQSLLGSGNITIQGGGAGAKVYAFNYSSWAYDIEDGHLNIPLATYEAMAADAQNEVPVILRLQSYSTSGGVITSGQCYDFYLYDHFVDGSASSLEFSLVGSWSGAWYEKIYLLCNGSSVSFSFSEGEIEFKANKVNSITGNGSQNQYPSTSAVVNYVTPRVLPEVTSSDQGKLLYANYSSGVGSWVKSAYYFGSGGLYSEWNLGFVAQGTVGTTFISTDGLFKDDSSSGWSWIQRWDTSSGQYVNLQDYLDSMAIGGLPTVTSADRGRMLFVDYDSARGYFWSKNSPFYFGSLSMIGDPYWGILLQNSLDEQLNLSHEGLRYHMDSSRSAASRNWNWINYNYYDSTAMTRFTVGLQDTLDTKVSTTGNESVAGNKTFTDNLGVVDADHIVYSGGGGGGGFTRGTSSQLWTGIGSTLEMGSDEALAGEPKAFIISVRDVGTGVLMIVGDSTGVHGIYNTGSQHNYSSSFTKSYSNGVLTINAPTGVTFGDYVTYDIVYYYGDGTLTFKTSTIQPGSGVTAVTFTGTDLTEVPAMYACFLESAVNNEQYRRVAGYTNSAYSGSAVSAEGITFLTGGPTNTTSSFTATYQTGYSAGLNINSGGTNAGGYFHNPGTYTLYYLMASDIGSGGGGGGFQSLGDELDDIRDTISGIETLLAAI